MNMELYARLSVLRTFTKPMFMLAPNRKEIVMIRECGWNVVYQDSGIVWAITNDAEYQKSTWYIIFVCVGNTAYKRVWAIIYLL